LARELIPGLLAEDFTAQPQPMVLHTRRAWIQEAHGLLLAAWMSSDV